MSVMNDVIHSAVSYTERAQYFYPVGDGYLQLWLQDGPVNEIGRNGADPKDVIRFAIGMYTKLNEISQCRENALTITKLEEALHWQLARDRDRENRGVEGTNAP